MRGGLVLGLVLAVAAPSGAANEDLMRKMVEAGKPALEAARRAARMRPSRTIGPADSDVSPNLIAEADELVHRVKLDMLQKNLRPSAEEQAALRSALEDVRALPETRGIVNMGRWTATLWLEDVLLERATELVVDDGTRKFREPAEEQSARVRIRVTDAQERVAADVTSRHRYDLTTVKAMQ